MAGFLGFGNYAKPGHGVGKDEPQKHSFFLFFEVYFRKFWKLCQANMIFFVCCIPFLLPFALVGMYLYNNIALYYLSMIPFIGVAVLVSGLTYILRNFARQEHAFIWGDFKDTIKKNWKQSIQIGLIDFVVYFTMVYSIYFYFHSISRNYLYSIPLVLCIIFTIIFTFMQYYLFVMMITFDLTTKQLLKNAFLFAFAGLGRNLLITIFLGIFVLLIYITSPLSYFLIPFILVSTFGFIIVFNSWPLIDKFMMPKQNEDEDEEIIFTDTGRENK